MCACSCAGLLLMESHCRAAAANAGGAVSLARPQPDQQCRPVQVGAVTAVSGRAIWRFSDKSTARIVLRVGTAGIDLELGGTQRISEFSTAGLGVSVGLMVSAPCSHQSCTDTLH